MFSNYHYNIYIFILRVFAERFLQNVISFDFHAVSTLSLNLQFLNLGPNPTNPHKTPSKSPFLPKIPTPVIFDNFSSYATFVAKLKKPKFPSAVFVVQLWKWRGKRVHAKSCGF